MYLASILLVKYILEKYIFNKILFQRYRKAMARVPITVMGFRCERCRHEWIPRRENDKEPRVCPKCKSPYWDRPRKATAMMIYEEFRDTVKRTLRAAKQPITWTELRTAANLPQALPNNQWVRRMETDIGLKREKDKHGVIHWRLS